MEGASATALAMATHLSGSMCFPLVEIRCTLREQVHQQPPTQICTAGKVKSHPENAVCINNAAFFHDRDAFRTEIQCRHQQYGIERFFPPAKPRDGPHVLVVFLQLNGSVLRSNLIESRCAKFRRGSWNDEVHPSQAGCDE